MRVPESKEKLDNTDIHPDQYELAKYIIENSPHLTSPEGRGIEQFFEVNKITLKELYPDINV
ncbi:MAG: hypothetical protein U9Q66_02660 [Patescibacteria group bacterium]|nr:hypothetical protein [Patescibacteria group bacterium]